MTGPATAVNLYRMGFQPVRVLPRSKRAFIGGYNDRRYGSEEEVARDFQDGENVGALLGEPSGWIVDVDLDTPDAVRHGGEILPPTACFGRPGKPKSHFLYRCRIDSNTDGWKDDRNRKILELRSTRLYTVMPGSIHEGSGELIEWVTGMEALAEIEPSELLFLLDKVATRSGWARPEPKPARRPSAVPRPVTAGDYRWAARKAFDAEIANLRSTSEGGRNTQLNLSAFNLFQLVQSGALGEAEVRTALWETAISIPGKDGPMTEREITASMESAWYAALRKPRAPLAGRGPNPMIESKPRPEPTTVDYVGIVEELVADLAGSQGRTVGGIWIPGYYGITQTLFGLRGYCLLTGPSGMGKTTLVNSIAINVATGEDVCNGYVHPCDVRSKVVLVTAEMGRTDIALDIVSMLTKVSKRTLIVGEPSGSTLDRNDVRSARLKLTEATRERVESALVQLHQLEAHGWLRIVSARSLIGGWHRDDPEADHALHGIEQYASATFGEDPGLLVIDTLATLNVQPAEGDRHRSDLDADGDIVDGINTMKERHKTWGILAVHEESKAATGTGDGMSGRGSSRFFYSSDQRLAMISSEHETEGTRKLGIRTSPASEDVTEIDLKISKGRRGGQASTTVTMSHLWRESRITEGSVYTLSDFIRARRERPKGKGA